MSSEAGRTGGRRGGADTGGIFSRVSRRGTQAQEAERAAEPEPREAEREGPQEGPGTGPTGAGAASRSEVASRPDTEAPEPGASEAPAIPRNGEAPAGREGPRRLTAAGGDAVDGAGDLSVPGGEPFGTFLDRGLTGERRPKDYSAPAISDHHADILDEDRKLLKELGYTRRQLSVGNMIELAVELQHEYVRRLVDERRSG